MYNSTVISQIYIKVPIIDQSEIIMRASNTRRQHSSGIWHKIVTSFVVYICMYIYRLARVRSRFGMQRYLLLMRRKLKMLNFCDNRSLDIKLVTLSVDFSTMSICWWYYSQWLSSDKKLVIKKSHLLYLYIIIFISRNIIIQKKKNSIFLKLL